MPRTTWLWHGNPSRVSPGTSSRRRCSSRALVHRVHCMAAFARWCLRTVFRQDFVGGQIGNATLRIKFIFQGLKDSKYFQILFYYKPPITECPRAWAWAAANFNRPLGRRAQRDQRNPIPTKSVFWCICILFLYFVFWCILEREREMVGDERERNVCSGGGFDKNQVVLKTPFSIAIVLEHFHARGPVVFVGDKPWEALLLP